MGKIQIFIRIIIPALIPVILGLVLSNIGKMNSKELIKNLDKEHIVIRLPKVYLWIGCLDISFFITCFLLMIWFPNDTISDWVLILFVLFVLIGVAIVLETQFWKIEIFRNKNYFLLRTILLKKRKILYSECKSYKYTSNYIVLKTDKKIYHIDSHVTNIEYLLVMLNRHKIKNIK